MSDHLSTIIEITDTAIKLLQAGKTRGKTLMTFCGFQEIPQATDEELSKILLKYIESTKIKPVNLIGIIPRQFVILRHLTLPTGQEAEIEKMVSLQFAKLIPYSKEDVIVHHRVLHKESSGYTKVLLMAVHRDVATRMLKILQSAKCNPQRLAFSSLGLLEWLTFQNQQTNMSQDDSTMLVSIDTSATEICFCQQQKLLFSRHINLGARDLHPDGLAAFKDQIQLTVSAYSREKIGADIRRVILVCAIKEAELLRSHLEGEFKIPVGLAEPFSQMSFKKDLRMPFFERQGVSMAVLCGVALSDHKKMIDLMPHEISDKRRSQKNKQDWVKCLILLFLVILAVLSNFIVKTDRDSSYLSQLQKKVEESQVQVEHVRTNEKQLQFIERRLNPSSSAIDILRELYQLTPAQVSFSVLYLDENNALAIQGVSQESSAVNVFQNKLVGSVYFKDVTLQYATKRKIFQGELTDFKITCNIASKTKESLP